MERAFTSPHPLHIHYQEEEEDGRDDAEESHKLDKKLRKLLHLAPATARACHAPSSFPTPAEAPPLPRLPPVAPLAPQAARPIAFTNQVKDVTILTAPKPNAQIPSLHADAEELRRRQARAQRFAASSSLASSRPSSSSSSSTFFSQGNRGGKETKERYHKRTRPLVGTCMVVEKKYMRSMEEVDPSTVRPPRVLREVGREGGREEGGREGGRGHCIALHCIKFTLYITCAYASYPTSLLPFNSLSSPSLASSLPPSSPPAGPAPSQGSLDR